MRTYSDPSTMTIKYPDNQVFSGDLNLIKITKNTTATHVQISFNLGADPFNYKENLYFLTNDIVFSLADTLKLIYARTVNTAFQTGNSFYFTVKLYNNTSLLDTENLSIEAVYLGKRRVFDELGVIPTISIVDFDQSIGINAFYYYIPYQSEVSYVVGGVESLLGTFAAGLTYLDFSAVSGVIDSIYFIVKNYMLNPTFQYLGGSNYWSTDEYVGCSSLFGVTVANKLVCNIPDESCGNTFTIDYSGRTFVPGVSYSIWITIDAVNNPSGNEFGLTVSLGGNDSTLIDAIGTTNVVVVCGAGGLLQLTAFMNADTGGYGAHGFSVTNIQIKDYEITTIDIDNDCNGNGVGQKLGLRFLNRFSLWRYYYVILKTENIASSNGISLWFLDENETEYNSLYSEQQKGYSQGLQVFREGVTKEIAKDFSDIIYSDHVHLYDDVNEVWIPVKVNTNTFNIAEKETLFDVSLNLLLQSNNE